MTIREACETVDKKSFNKDMCDTLVEIQKGIVFRKGTSIIDCLLMRGIQESYKDIEGELPDEERKYYSGLMAENFVKHMVCMEGLGDRNVTGEGVKK